MKMLMKIFSVIKELWKETAVEDEDEHDTE